MGDVVQETADRGHEPAGVFLEEHLNQKRVDLLIRLPSDRIGSADHIVDGVRLVVVSNDCQTAAYKVMVTCLRSVHVAALGLIDVVQPSRSGAKRSKNKKYN